MRPNSGSKRTKDHKTFKSQVGDTGFFREYPAKGSKNQCRSKDKRRIDNLPNCQQVHLQHLLFLALGVERFKNPAHDALCRNEEDNRTNYNPNNLWRYIRSKAHTSRSIGKRTK
ncbi:hypothetical protein D3C76_1218030 [compost metagenome]